MVWKVDVSVFYWYEADFTDNPDFYTYTKKIVFLQKFLSVKSEAQTTMFQKDAINFKHKLYLRS